MHCALFRIHGPRGLGDERSCGTEEEVFGSSESQDCVPEAEHASVRSLVRVQAPYEAEDERQYSRVLTEPGGGHR